MSPLNSALNADYVCMSTALINLLFELTAHVKAAVLALTSAC